MVDDRVRDYILFLRNKGYDDLSIMNQLKLKGFDEYSINSALSIINNANSNTDNINNNSNNFDSSLVNKKNIVNVIYFI
jgi:hypothetical protein